MFSHDPAQKGCAQTAARPIFRLTVSVLTGGRPTAISSTFVRAVMQLTVTVPSSLSTPTGSITRSSAIRSALRG